MSSAGHILDSIKRMKANRALRSRRDSFDIKEANTFRPNIQKRDYRFNTPTKAYLNNLKAKLTRERKRELIKHLLILLLSMAIFSLLFLL